MAANGDYYKILGVSRTATESEIKKVYRKLALQYHPDRNPGDKKSEEHFKKINEAYAVLSDKEKRAQYDRFGSAGFHQRYTQEDIFRGFDVGDLFKDMGYGSEDIFSRIFSNGRRGPGSGPGFGGRTRGGGVNMEDLFGGGGFGQQQADAPQGRDLTMDLAIDFMEAVNGCEKKIAYIVDGKRNEITVKIPRGISSGQKLRLAGKGEHGMSQAAGDLFVTIQVKDHPLFKREGNDVIIEQKIKLTEALLGTTIEVPTLNGTKSVKVPAGVQSQTRLRLKGCGIPHFKGGGQGDAYVKIIFSIPKHLTPHQKKLIESLAEEGL
ncbi:MAG: DnaJ domain-containing protein [Proteobacteria bacterium]|nr:DnaJ domain-containing protein [Pseudomonadota bacterium]